MNVDARLRLAAHGVKVAVGQPEPADLDRPRRTARRRMIQRRVLGVALVVVLLGVSVPLLRNVDHREEDLIGRIKEDERGKRVEDSSVADRRDERGGGAGTGSGLSPLGSGQTTDADRTDADSEPVAAGGRIYYTEFPTSTGSGGPQASIWVMNSDGSDRRRLADGYKPDPTRDGRRVAFVRGNDECGARSPTYGYCSEVWVMNDDGSDQHVLGLGESPDWSPDGTRIAYTKPDTENYAEWDGDTGNVYVMNADGSQERLLYRGDVASRMRPRWSPDGKALAVVTESPPDNDLGCTGIYVGEIDGPDSYGFVQPGCYVGSPNWSPDGKRLVFFSSRGRNTLDIGIYVANRDGSGVRQLTPKWDGDEPQAALSPSWSLNGKRITYTFDADGDSEETEFIVFCRRIGSGSSHIEGGGWAGCRAPGPMPGEVYVMNADGSHPTRLAQGQYPEYSS